jgi:hypothetical protein
LAEEKVVRWTRPFKTTLVALSIVTVIASAASSVAAATTDPYTSGTSGYDVSYPQCPGSVSPGGAFGIVGVNGGRPFTHNSCLGTEYGAAPKSPAPSLYINTGYSGAYRKSVTSNCSNLASGVVGTSQEQQAWAIGCSEAETSLAYASAQGAASVAMWWLDVETGNSWSSSSPALNQNTIQGAVSRLAQAGLPVGVYSTSSMWTTITGGNFTPTGQAADWVASGSCSTPFTKSPGGVWLVQSVVGGVDTDHAC